MLVEDNTMKKVDSKYLSMLNERKEEKILNA